MRKRPLFWPRSDRTDTYKRRFALYELVYTIIDFTAAGLFVVGSVMFFSEDWQRPGTWCFLLGSLCFAAKPTLRLIREIRLAEEGQVSKLAERYGDEE